MSRLALHSLPSSALVKLKCLVFTTTILWDSISLLIILRLKKNISFFSSKDKLFTSMGLLPVETLVSKPCAGPERASWEWDTQVASEVIYPQRGSVWEQRIISPGILKKASRCVQLLFFMVKCQTKPLKDLAAHHSSKGKDHGRMPECSQADVAKIRCLFSKLFTMPSASCSCMSATLQSLWLWTKECLNWRNTTSAASSRCPRIRAISSFTVQPKPCFLLRVPPGGDLATWRGLLL